MNDFELWAIALAAIATLGLILLVLRMLPADPALGDAMERLSGAGPDPYTVDTSGGENLAGSDALSYRVGARFYPRLRSQPWFRIPTTDLAILRETPQKFIGDKILSAAIGLIIVPVSLALLALFGITVPFVFPAAGSLVLALVGFFAPDADVKTRAASARLEFTRALAAFIDFVSLNRSGGVAAFQSLERAAAVGDSWVFLRLDAELQKASLAGQAPWAALSNLAGELALPELGDLADIMTYTGDQGASVADTLAARAGALRSALLSKEQGEAGARTKKMDAPLGALAVLFMIMLLVPAAVNIMGI